MYDGMVASYFHRLQFLAVLQLLQALFGDVLWKEPGEDRHRNDAKSGTWAVCKEASGPWDLEYFPQQSAAQSNAAPSVQGTAAMLVR